MICFMFPGQPLSRAAALPEDADFAQIAELVHRIAHFDLATFEWIYGEGRESVKFQLSGVAQSLYGLRRLRRLGMRPDLVAEHSMGIYPALVACDSLPEAQAIEITWRVGETLVRLAGTQQYAVGSVVGLPLEPVLCLARNNHVHLANHNTSRHFLLSGKRDDIALAMAEATAAGAYSAQSFQCDAPLHTPLMAPLERDLREIFADYRYRSPAPQLLDHLDQQYLTSADIPRFLLWELSMPVYWERSYRTLRAAGARQFYEVGTGAALQKYNRWIDADSEDVDSRAAASAAP